MHGTHGQLSFPTLEISAFTSPNPRSAALSLATLPLRLGAKTSISTRLSTNPNRPLPHDESADQNSIMDGHQGQFNSSRRNRGQPAGHSTILAGMALSFGERTRSLLLFTASNTLPDLPIVLDMGSELQRRRSESHLKSCPMIVDDRARRTDFPCRQCLSG